MSILRIALLGKLDIQYGNQSVPGVEAQKVQELLSYLLINRHTPHNRELLASQLWSDVSTLQSRRYLRQTLWQLQSALRIVLTDDEPILRADAEWIQVNTDTSFWLDIAILERTYLQVQSVRGCDLSEQQVRMVEDAVQVYRGDLLEGWFLDWCIHERERIQSMYLTMLDKLLDSLEFHSQYEAGIQFAQQVLRYDRAREQAYCRLMRLYYFAGDRTAALRQYATCVAALDEELGVAPTDHTRMLYEQIQSDQLKKLREHFGPLTSEAIGSEAAHDTPSPPEMMDQLKQIRSALSHLLAQVDLYLHDHESSVHR